MYKVLRPKIRFFDIAKKTSLDSLDVKLRFMLYYSHIKLGVSISSQTISYFRIIE